MNTNAQQNKSANKNRYKISNPFEATIKTIIDKKTDYLKLSKYFIIILSIIVFIIASKGFDILYLFLLADLFCCAFVITVFYSNYSYCFIYGF